MAIGLLTPLQLDAGAGLLQNQGIAISAELVAAINAYLTTPLITALVDAGQESAGIGAATCPSLSDSVPIAYSSLGNCMTTVITDEATIDICGGNVSKFSQALNIAMSYGSQSNDFINSAVNSQTYLGNTFTSMNSMITGDITQVNLATTAFGTDLINLGQLINLNNLGNLGSPLALIQQMYSIAGAIPVVSVAFISVGVPQDVVINLTNPTASVVDSIQRLMYVAMTQITGTDLAQILSVLKVTTVGINTMADLLNPVKLFPNSFQSLTVQTSVGSRAIYIDNTGSVNTGLVSELPPYVVSSVV